MRSSIWRGWPRTEPSRFILLNLLRHGSRPNWSNEYQPRLDTGVTPVLGCAGLAHARFVRHRRRRGDGLVLLPRRRRCLPSRGEPLSIIYEKGTPAWDIGQILTRHHQDHGGNSPCARVTVLRRSANPARDASGLQRMTAAERLDQALRTECTCGADDSPAETTSIKEASGGGR